MMPSAMMMTPAARNFGTAVLRGGGHRRHHGLGPTAAADIIPPALLSPINNNNKNNSNSAPRNNRSLASLARDGDGGGGPSSSHSLLILGKPGGGEGHDFRYDTVRLSSIQTREHRGRIAAARPKRHRVGEGGQEVHGRYARVVFSLFRFEEGVFFCCVYFSFTI